MSWDVPRPNVRLFYRSDATFLGATNSNYVTETLAKLSVSVKTDVDLVRFTQELGPHTGVYYLPL
jgi:hypothetical protein